MHTIAPHGEQGSALLAAMLTMTGIAVLSATVLTTGLSMDREQRGGLEHLQARYSAEAAIAAALVDLEAGGDGQPFTKVQPLDLGGSRAWASFQETPDELYSADCGSRLHGARIGLEVLVDYKSESLFQFGAFGENGLWMASNSMVDSYDSEDAAYAATNGSGSNVWCSNNAAVGSNGDIEMSQNSKVYGDLIPGPGGTATLLGSAVLTGGSYANSVNVELPPIDVPSLTPSGDVILGVNGSSILAPGNYQFGSFSLGKNSSLVISGPATLVVSDFSVASGSELLIDTVGGPVTIYVQNDFLVNSNTLIAPIDLDPKGLSFQLLSDNIIDPILEVDLDSVDFDSNAKMHASIYAPNAAIEINSNFELFGAIIAKELVLDSNCKVHYDESLAEAEQFSTKTLQIVGWREKGYGK